MKFGSIRQVSECFIKPDHIDEEKSKPFYLGSFELMQMSHSHIQTGLMFNKLPSNNKGGIDFFLQRLKHSLSSTLARFYPLAGQFVTEVDEAQHSSFIYLDINKGNGAKFIHAYLDDITVDDLISPTYVPRIVQSLFALGRVPTNYDAHDEPILVIQLTQLVDGMFLGFSANHAVVDGATFWHFLSSWSDMFQSNGINSKQPTFDRWFPQGYGPVIKFPYIHPNEFIRRFRVDFDNHETIKEVIFHISSESFARLKAKANADCGLIGKISSLQALSALLMRALARARCLKPDVTSNCILVGNARSRLNPPLPDEYFGNFISVVIKSIRVGELLEKSIGGVAFVLNEGVADQLTGDCVRDGFIEWIKSPKFSYAAQMDSNTLFIGGVPRVDMKKLEFGLGEVVAIRSGSNKYDGRVILRPGMKEKESVNVEICLMENTMLQFQRDSELVTFLSCPS